MKAYQPTPLFVATVIILALTAAVLYLGAAILGFEASKHQRINDVTQGVTPAPQVEYVDWRPDIRHCHHPDVDLWNCISNPGEFDSERRAELRRAMRRDDL